MSSKFFRVVRARDADHPRGILLGLTLAGLLLAGWLGWFFAVHLTLYEISTRARLEVQQLAHAIETPVGGQILSHQLIVGREVHEGEVLLELDARTFSFGLEEARARLRESESAAALSAEELSRSRELAEKGQVSQMDFIRLKAAAEKNVAARDELGVTVQRLSFEVERRKLRAPVSGSIGEVLPGLHVGSVLEAGKKLATLIPPGEFKMISYFPPSAAIGRLKAGQRARLRFQGFPWAEFGTTSAMVESVASEVRDGEIRVESTVSADPRSRIPLQHGLPGTVEVEVDRVTPATLFLRAAGAFFTRDSAPGRDSGAGH